MLFIDGDVKDPLILPPRAHVMLVRCCVQFLGRAAPCDTPDGVTSVQKALHEVYNDNCPIDAFIYVYTSGILLQTNVHLENKTETWLPMQDMVVCGAMKAIGEPPEVFLPLGDGDQSPGVGQPVFVFVFRRPDIPTADCWVVECETEESALTLYRYAKLAHESPAGHPESKCDKPPPVCIRRQDVAVLAMPENDWDGAVVRDNVNCGQVSGYVKQFYEKPSLTGYFYTPNQCNIQKYCLRTNDYCAPEEDRPQEKISTPEPAPAPVPAAAATQTTNFCLIPAPGQPGQALCVSVQCNQPQMQLQPQQLQPPPQPPQPPQPLQQPQPYEPYRERVNYYIKDQKKQKPPKVKKEKTPKVRNPLSSLTPDFANYPMGEYPQISDLDKADIHVNQDGYRFVYDGKDYSDGHVLVHPDGYYDQDHGKGDKKSKKKNKHGKHHGKHHHSEDRMIAPQQSRKFRAPPEDFQPVQPFEQYEPQNYPMPAPDYRDYQGYDPMPQKQPYGKSMYESHIAHGGNEYTVQPPGEGLYESRLPVPDYQGSQGSRSSRSSKSSSVISFGSNAYGPRKSKMGPGPGPGSEFQGPNDPALQMINDNFILY